MSLIPGTLPSGACYGTPQELLDLFAQYLDVPAFAVSSKVIYSATSPMPNTDFVWVDTAGATTPVLKLYNEIIGDYQEYPFQGQLSPAGAETLISGKSAITTLASSDLFLVSQAGTSAVLKKITWANATASIPSGTVTYPMLSTSATEADNVAKRTAKAWVNFNGTGTVAIRDDFNVSSITDNGTGDYRVNFLSAMSNTNYSVVMSNKPADNNTSTLDVNCPYGILTGSFSMKNSNSAGNTTDSVLNFAAVFGS